MLNNIIDDIDKLIDMPREELDEILLDKKYNKALLRELIRRCIRELKFYKEQSDYWFNEWKKSKICIHYEQQGENNE